MTGILDKYEISDDIKENILSDLQKEVDNRVLAAQNDPNYNEKIRSEIAGKFYSDAERFIKSQFGVDLEKLDSELKGNKRLKAALSLGADTLKTSGDQTNQALQQQLLDVKNQFDSFKEGEHVNAINEIKSKYNSKLIDAKIYQDASSIKVISPEIDKLAFIDVYVKKNNYKKVWNEEKEDYVILTKENLVPTKDGKALSNLDLFNDALSPVLERSNGNANNGNNGRKLINSNIPTANYSESTRLKAKKNGS